MKFFKFNLFFIPLVALSLGSVAYFARTLVLENAKEQVTQNAQIMMEVASSSRIYTTKQVQPLLQHKNFKLQTAIEEFRKALDDLPKEADAIRVPDAFDTKVNSEPELKPPELKVQESTPASPKESSAPTVPETLPASTPPRSLPDSTGKAATQMPAKEISDVNAKSPPAVSSKEEGEPPAKKPLSLWKRLFGPSPKEEQVSNVKDSSATTVPAAHSNGKDSATPSVAVVTSPGQKDARPSKSMAASGANPSDATSPTPVEVAAGSTRSPQVVPAEPIVKPTPGPTAKEGFLLGRQRVLDEQKKYIDSLKSKPEEMLDTEFHPQSVPAYAATEIFNVLRQKYPDYFYKEATLNPTNLRNRTTDWEADIVNGFRANTSLTELIGTRSTPTGDAFYLARPIKVTNVSCLACHSTPDKAPPEMLNQYGSANGFGWKMDEIIGAQVVTVPTSVSTKTADTSWKSLARWLVAAFAGIVVTGNLGFGIALRPGKSKGPKN
jgi:hypothetical protein